MLVHGFTQTGASWGSLVDELAREHEVVVVDAPGHGRSGDVVADLPTTGALLADAGGEGTYVGYSMGARMCLHAALVAPDRVRSLVVLGATGGIDDDLERAARRRSDDELADRIEQIGVAAFLDEWLTQPMFAAVPAGDRSDRLANTAPGLASSLRHAGTGTQVPLWDRLGEIEVPTLVLAGERDAKFQALAERLAAGIGASAELAIVADAGHAAHLEQRGLFLDVLLGFLTRAAPGRG